MLASRTPKAWLIFAIFLLGRSVLTWAVEPYALMDLTQNETSDEGKIRQLRDEEIRELRIALGRREGVHRRADLYLRLAELDLESFHEFYLLEGRVHEKKVAQGQNDPYIDHSHSKPFLGAGVNACKEILSFGINYEKMDHVYYFLGVNYAELSNHKDSLKYYKELTERYPQSPFVGEAYRELGKDAYEAHNYKAAIPFFELAAQKGDADSKPRVLHMLAWSYYHTRQTDKAIATMKQAISLASQDNEKFLNLHDEALRDMAIFMTENGDVEQAITYFQNAQSDKTFYPRTLERLGKQYERNVEPQKAIIVYESLLKTNPDSEEAFRVRVKLVDLDLRASKFKEALARLDGVKIPTSGETDTMVAAQNLRAMVRRTATEHHEIYRKTSAKPALEIAELYYTAYLNLFLSKDDPKNETPEIEMYLAEVKQDFGKTDEASALYRKVLDSKDKRYAKEAAALWTASLADEIKKTGKAQKTNEPSALEKEYISAADKLQSSLPDTPEGREATLKAAEVEAGYKSTQKDATDRCKKLIADAPKSPQAVTAGRLWLQVLTDDPTRTDDLKKVTEDLAGNSELMAADAAAGGKLKITIDEQEVKLKVGKIADEEHEKNYEAAGKDYEKFAGETKNREIAEKAYANGLSSYLKSGNAEAMERIVDLWLGRYPKSPKAMDAIKLSSTTLLIQGRFSLAASFFEKIGRQGEEPTSMETAARIYEGDGDIARSQEIYKNYLELFPSSPGRYRVALALARSHDAQKEDSLAIKYYLYCMEGVEVAAEAGSRLADLYYRDRDITRTKETFKKVSVLDVKESKESKSVSPFVSYARYRLADFLEQDAHLASLNLPEERLKKGLNQRLEFLESLSRAYSAAVESGGPWAIASLQREALWVLNFANEVDRIQAPGNASASALAKFKKQLASISGPLRQKALTTWQEGYSRANSSEIYSPVLPDIGDQLAEAQVATPMRAQGFKGKFRLAGLPADGGPDGATESFEKIRETLLRNPQDSAAWTDYGNLLWGAKRPLLAKLAYERALSLNSKNAAALNNRGIIAVSGAAEEDWFQVAEGRGFSRCASTRFAFLASQINRGALLNYFRLFGKAEPLWEQIVARGYSGDAQDGLGIALQGMGNPAAAEVAFSKATESGSPKSRFTAVFHEAARMSIANPSKCLKRLDDLSENNLSGFERSAYNNLKKELHRMENSQTQGLKLTFVALALIGLGAIFFTAGVVLAQNGWALEIRADKTDSGSGNGSSSGVRVVYPKKTELDLEGMKVEGQINNPGEFYFQHQQEEKFDSLVKRRKDFHEQMLRDAVLTK